MIRRYVNSTNVRSVGFENNVLEVEFLNRRVYRYYGVPERHYHNMINYSHPGTYLHAHVIDRYDYMRVA